MRRMLFLALLLLAGCAGDTGPTRESGQIVGEIGEPRNRARLHTELAALYFGRGNMNVALEELRIAVRADSELRAGAQHVRPGVHGAAREPARRGQLRARRCACRRNDPDINHNYGWFLCQSAREADSIRYFLQAIRNPLYTTPWRSLLGGRRVLAAHRQGRRMPRSSSCARCARSPTSRPRCCSSGRSATARAASTRRASSSRATTSCVDAERRNRCGWRCASSASSASASPSATSPTSCAAAIPTRRSTRRCSGASLTEAAATGVGARARPGARGAGPGARRRRAAAQVRAAPARGARAGTLRRAARPDHRARHAAQLRAPAQARRGARCSLGSATGSTRPIRTSSPRASVSRCRSPTTRGAPRSSTPASRS